MSKTKREELLTEMFEEMGFWRSSRWIFDPETQLTTVTYNRRNEGRDFRIKYSFGSKSGFGAVLSVDLYTGEGNYEGKTHIYSSVMCCKRKSHSRLMGSIFAKAKGDIKSIRDNLEAIVFPI